MAGLNDFAPFRKKNGCFVVRNIGTNPKRTIRIFDYPINFGTTRDLLQIPGVAESDIRASLLKGELKNRIELNQVVVECSDIDLLQFNNNQKAFLQSAGISNGLEATSAVGVIPFILKQNVPLVGTLDGANRIFTVPSPDTFIDGAFFGNEFHIQVFHNGRKLIYTDDYIISESGGVGTGFDTIIIVSFSPISDSSLTADYVINNS